MMFEKEDLDKFDVMYQKGDDVTVSDGLMKYNVKITYSDIFNILLKSKFDCMIFNSENLSRAYDLHKNEVVREHIKNNFLDFKNAFINFYSNIRNFYFNDFNKWCNNYHYHWIAIDVNDKGYSFFKLEDWKTDVYSFQIENNIHDFYNKMQNLKDDVSKALVIQNKLTIRADDYRNRLLNKLNDNLVSYDLQPIPVQKYKDENKIINIIQDINSDRQEDIELFLDDYNTRDNHILSDCGDVYIDLFKENDGEGDYITRESYDTTNYGFINTITVNIDDILATDDILYQPTLKDCKAIKNRFDCQAYNCQKNGFTM